MTLLLEFYELKIVMQGNVETTKGEAWGVKGWEARAERWRAELLRMLNRPKERLRAGS
jgi:hypothetical protein